MNIYADEKFYHEMYLCEKNAVLTSSYEYFFREASLIIDHYTFGNIDPEKIPETVKMCCCELAENLFSESKMMSENAGIQSESVGGWSRSYTDKNQIRTFFRMEERRIIFKWLANTGLLYRGVEECL